MAALTIRNIPGNVIERLKKAAVTNGRSKEQEVRTLIESRYRAKEEVLRRIEERWKNLPKASPKEIESWIREGRT
jgi:plasmid stability protein